MCVWVSHGCPSPTDTTLTPGTAPFLCPQLPKEEPEPLHLPTVPEALKYQSWLITSRETALCLHAEPRGHGRLRTMPVLHRTSARHHPRPRGPKCCIVISERTWASFAGSAGPTPVSTADSSLWGWVVGQAEGPPDEQGTLPASPSSWEGRQWREAGGKPLEAHRQHSHLGWGMWEREQLASEAPARSWPPSSSSSFPVLALFCERGGCGSVGWGVLSQ